LIATREDIDFGMFVDEILKNPRKREKVGVPNNGRWGIIGLPRS
jgi:hypothetical protein